MPLTLRVGTNNQFITQFLHVHYYVGTYRHNYIFTIDITII